MGCQIEKVLAILNKLERNSIDVSELKAQVDKKIAEKQAVVKNGYTVTPGNSKVKVVESLLSESEQNTLKSTIENMLKDKSIDRVHNRTGQTGIAFGPVGYSYGKTRPVVHKQKDMPKELLELAEQISASLGRGNGYYNHVLINKFEDGVGIGMHPDNEEIYQNERGEVGAVAIYSIGSTKVPHIIEKEKYTAKDNSLIEMASGSMYHSVGAANGIRYSLTFRHVPENRLPKNTKSVVTPEYTFKSMVSSKEVSLENKMRQLISIYKDDDAPKIGGGLVEDVTRKSVYDEGAKAATMMKGTQDSTLKDMLPKVDGRTISAYEKAVNVWYGEMKRGSAIQNKLSEFAKLIETIEYSPELMEELGWSKESDKQEAGIILPNEIVRNNINRKIKCKRK